MEQAIAPTSGRSSGIPWYAWTSAIAVTSIAAGLYWDISWHMSIGRDTFWTPAHLAIHFGAIGAVTSAIYLILIAALMNRAQGELRNRLNYAFLYVGCLLLVIHMMLIMEYTDHTLMHSGIFYRTVALGIPMILVGLARASGYRWACTMAAGMYTALWLAAEWLVPLVPAEPK